MTDVNALYLEIGEVLSGLRALAETIEVRDQQTQKLQDLIRAELSTLRQDQRDLEEKLDCIACVMQHDVEALRSGAAESGRSVDDLVQAMLALRGPVQEIIALRSRAAGLLLGAGLIGSALLWLAAPLYRWIIDANVSRH